MPSPLFVVRMCLLVFTEEAFSIVRDENWSEVLPILEFFW